MSVLKVNRTPSKYEATTDATALYNMLMDLAERNFGVKDLNKFVRTHATDDKTLEENVAKYSYFIHDTTVRIEKYAAAVTNNLRAAYTSYPSNMERLTARRAYQDKAVVYCELIIDELQRVVTKLDVDINLYEQHIKAINREIDKIKRWRQRDNHLESRFNKTGNV